MSDHYTKPIMLARFPSSASKDHLIEFYEYLEKKLSEDYHVLGIIDNVSTEMSIEVYNALDSELVTIELLKKEIKESFDELKTNLNNTKQ